MLCILILCLWSVYLSRSESQWARYTAELYLGWITVATTANIAIVTVSTPWIAQIGMFGANIWAVVGLGIATVVHTFVALRYRVYIPGLVLIWALVANIVAHPDLVQRLGVGFCIAWMIGVFGWVYFQTHKK
jgi:hypothetical protein